MKEQKKIERLKIQIPLNPEARRCVEIVIENHIGILEKIIVEKGVSYVLVIPYKPKKIKSYIHLDGSVVCTKCELTKKEGCNHNI